MNLRLAIIASIALLFSASSSFAMMYGSPVSSLNAGNVSLGFGYGAQSYDVKDANNMQLHQNLGYVQFNMGLGGGWEVYARGGVGDMNLERIAGDELRDTVKPFSGGGFNGRLYDGQVLDIAVFGQGNFYTFEDFEDNNTGADLVLSKFWDASAGFAARLEIEGAFLYAGPYYYMWEAELEVGGVTSDIKNKNQIGTMVGVRWPLVSGWELDLEGQLADKYVFGAALNYPF